MEAKSHQTSKSKLLVTKKRQIKMGGSKNVLVNQSMEVMQQSYASQKGSCG